MDRFVIAEVGLHFQFMSCEIEVCDFLTELLSPGVTVLFHCLKPACPVRDEYAELDLKLKIQT